MAQIKQVGIGRKSTGTIDGITYYTLKGKTFARSTPTMPASVYNTPEAKTRQAIFKFVQMHMKHHLRTIRQTITAKDGTPCNRYYSINKNGLNAALQTLAEQYVAGTDVTITDIEAAISAYAVEHPTSIRIASLSGYQEVYLAGEWPATITLNALEGDSTVIIIVNENGVQTTIAADGTVTTGQYTGGNSGSGSTVNGSGSESGNSGSVDPNPVNPDSPAGGGAYTITAAVGNDGGGSVTIKKNGIAVEGSSVQASASDSIVMTAVEDSGYQFLGWADGNSDNPRTITPSADATFTASFMDLSNV